MQIHEIISILESWAPPIYQESYDNSGLLVGDSNVEVTKALITLDCTEAVIDEAIQEQCNLIIAHHPIIFSGLKQIIGQNYVERTILKAIKNDIAIYAIHTNLDNIASGVNSMISARIGLQNTKILSPKQSIDQNLDNQIVGSGMIGDLKEEMSLKEFLQFLKIQFDLKAIKYTEFSKKIKRVAVCGGSGSFLRLDAYANNADAFITSDFKYHEWFDSEGQMSYIDIGHYESERFTKELIYDYLKKNALHLHPQISGIDTNPVKIYTL
jgi:dinuclear metal center YbgI/SA1388 family protein